MYIQVTKSIFIEAFKAIRPENFSYDALGAMFDYFDDFGSDVDVELDVIAICCDFSEYTSLVDYNEQHGTAYESLGELEQYTTVIEVGNESFVAVSF
jgi:hypothetical protein